MNENPRTIYNDSTYHYLDYGKYPWLLSELYSEQLCSRAVDNIATTLRKKIHDSDGTKARLRHIQNFIHNKTHHIKQHERITLFGYVQFEDIPYYEDELIQDSFETIKAAGNAHGAAYSWAQEWDEDYTNKRCVGSKNGPLDRNFEPSNMFKGLPGLQCSEEATLAAALATHIADIPQESIYFIGSPAHVSVFIRPQPFIPKGVIFDSKMLLFPQNVHENSQKAQERKNQYLARFGHLWFLTNSIRTIDAKASSSNGDHEAQFVLEEFNHFFGLEMN